MLLFLVTWLKKQSVREVVTFCSMHRVILFLLVLASILSFFAATEPVVHLLQMLRLYAMILFSIAGVQTITTNKSFFKRYLPYGIMGVVSIVSLLAISQILNQGSLNGIWYFLGERSFTAETPGIANASIQGNLVLRPYATFPHPNVLATFLYCSLFFLYFWQRQAKITNVIKCVTWSILLLTVFVLFLTLSRTVLLLFIIGSIILLCSHVLKLKKGRRTIPVLAGTVLFITVIGFFLFPRYAGLLIDNAIAERVVLLSQAFHMLESNLITGIGMNHFIIRLSETGMPASLLQPVHNIFVLVFVEMGLLGGTLFIWFLFNLFKRINRTKKNQYKSALLYLFISFLIIGMTDHFLLTLHQGQLLFSLFIIACYVFTTQPVLSSSPTKKARRGRVLSI